MTSQINLYEYVLACLRAKTIPQKQVAAESGVPFSTVAKIAQGSVTDPSVHTVQKLYDYFVRHRVGVASRSSPSPPPTSGEGAKRGSPTAEPVSIAASAETDVCACRAGERKTAGSECVKIV